MREPEIISKEIQDLDEILLSSQELSLKFPEDNILRLSISQTEFRKKGLVSELDKSLEYYGQQSIKYIFKDVNKKINLDSLLINLSSFKTLIDNTFEKVTNGKKNNMPIYFNTVFSGSYGVQLSTPFEEKLFDHEYEASIDETFRIITELLNASDKDLRNSLKREFGGNRKLLNKYSSFFNKINQTNKTVEIIWSSPHTKEQKQIQILPDKAKKLYSIFTEKEKSEKTIVLLGILKGISLIRYKVEFSTDPEGKDFFTAKFNEQLADDVIDFIDKYVYAEFKVEISYNESRDQQEKKYELLSIKPQQ